MPAEDQRLDRQHQGLDTQQHGVNHAGGVDRMQGDAPQPATFCVFDHTWGPAPVACDFALVSDSLRGHVQGWRSDGATQLSDHQPVLLTLA